MDANLLFPKTFFKAADFPAPRILTVQGCGIESLPGGESKPALMFLGEQQKLILNKTNTQMMIGLYGAETDNWAGKPIEIYPDKVPMQGRIVDAIRIRQPQQVRQPMEPGTPELPSNWSL